VAELADALDSKSSARKGVEVQVLSPVLAIDQTAVTTANCRIEHLFQHVEHVDRVARWIFDEFWGDKNVHTPESLARLLRQAVAPDAIPLSLVAFVDDSPVGTANLIENDDDSRPHLRPWLAALYVAPGFRRRGVGSALVGQVGELAATLGIGSLFLGTDNSGFYARFGAVIHEQAAADFAIMRLPCPVDCATTHLSDVSNR
jgi:predicted N-acetyltransferase YhbS